MDNKQSVKIVAKLSDISDVYLDFSTPAEQKAIFTLLGLKYDLETVRSNPRVYVYYNDNTGQCVISTTYKYFKGRRHYSTKLLTEKIGNSARTYIPLLGAKFRINVPMNNYILSDGKIELIANQVKEDAIQCRFV